MGEKELNAPVSNHFLENVSAVLTQARKAAKTAVNLSMVYAYFENMSYAQAAEVTGKTVKQITNMVYRGKESLRRLLEREGITNAES